jgi:hypothetical protein
MNRPSDLDGALQRLSQTLPRQASPATEQLLLSVFRARYRRIPKLWKFFGAAAACVAIALASFWVGRAWRPAPPLVPIARDSITAAGFVALPYAQSDVPVEQIVIVRVNLRPADWAALGAAVTFPRTAHTVSADLLIGQDGVARAVRLVSIQ